MPLSSDENFDDLARQLWNEHIRSLDTTVAETKRWKSGYWKKWYRDLVLDVSESEFSDEWSPVDSECVEHESGICEPLWSNAGSPPLADDDRRERPAAQREHQ